MQLRPYQQEALDAIKRDWNAGRRNVLLVAATGAGKTNIFLRLLLDELTEPGTRALILAHRRELIDQPLARIRSIDPSWLLDGVIERPRVGVLQAEHNDVDRQLTIATVQSVRAARLNALLAHGPITHLVTDECHHAVAASYLRVYETLKEANPDLLHLGVTATPLRADGDGLSRVYETVSARITIADLVKLGWLIQPRWLGISTGISISGVHSRHGDFVQSELASCFDTDAGRRVIVQAYQEYAPARRAIAFTASVAGAHALARAFTTAGIVAAAIDGTTPADERARILGNFREGRITVVTNCQVLTEGFDAPGTSCILMCRPTRSDSLYVQCMGRGLRPVNGKAEIGEDCLILDFLPIETRNIVMAGDVLGIPKEHAAAARELLNEQTDAGEVQLGFTFDGESFDTSGTPLEIVARQLNYLQASMLAWFPPRGIRRTGEVLTVGIGTGSDGIERILAIRDDVLYGIGRRSRDEQWNARPILTADPYAEAEDIAVRHGVGILMTKAAAWRNAGLSESQERYLRSIARHRLTLDEIRALSKGDAAAWITHLQATRALERLTFIAAAQEAA